MKLLDDCLSQQEPLKSDEKMAIWASLWQMMLMYRALTIQHETYFARNPAASSDPNISKSAFMDRHR